MDIASLSTVLNMSKANNDIGTIMLSKQLDLAQEQGDSMAKALELSVTPYLGSNFDVSI